MTHFDYSYDDLYQLTSELGSVSNNYTYDSIYNRLSKDGKPVTVNSLNQVLETEEESFTFDADGNPISCITPSGEIFYSYDALDRLISVTNHGKTTRYAYDSFNRRLIKKADREKYFLYQDANEIGCLEEGYLTEFRVLGDQGLSAEIGCAVAIELQGIAYAPIHDLSGNVIALIDSEGHPYETYRYSSFGEEHIFDASQKNVGRGNLCSEKPLSISGFTYHGVNRAIERNVRPKAIHDAINNPLKVCEKKLIKWVI